MAFCKDLLVVNRNNRGSVNAYKSRKTVRIISLGLQLQDSKVYLVDNSIDAVM